MMENSIRFGTIILNKLIEILVRIVNNEIHHSVFIYIFTMFANESTQFSLKSRGLYMFTKKLIYSFHIFCSVQFGPIFYTFGSKKAS